MHPADVAKRLDLMADYFNTMAKGDRPALTCLTPEMMAEAAREGAKRVRQLLDLKAHRP